MAAVKTINFLPDVFKSDANKKFLNATLDQLVSEPNFNKVNGYIGRKFAPTYKNGDSYVNEPSKERQSYQLEASISLIANSNVIGANVATTTPNSDVLFYNSYTDILQKIRYYGGLTNDHSRLFSNESYTFDGMFDFDKFINFNQYLWLPNGVPSVTVSAITSSKISDYTVTKDSTKTAYSFTGFGTDPNPTITLIRGNTYKFKINQDNPFWIQTTPGKSGSRSIESERLSRLVYGVVNNGENNGEITFRVPSSDAQNYALQAIKVANVDYATTLKYSDIQNHLVSIVAKNGGIDGVTSSLSGRTIIFLNEDESNSAWTASGSFDLNGFDNDTPSGFESGNLVPSNLRRNVWRIVLVDVGGGKAVIQLQPFTAVNSGEKVYVMGGNTYSTVEFIKNASNKWEEIPPITASLPFLYYNDDIDSEYAGQIKLVDPNGETINVDNDILGRKTYTSPNGVKFTNGLNITFDSTVIPAIYANNTYIVEGVGKEIRLVNAVDLLTPESYAKNNELADSDYMTINRSSKDGNAWSRSNRWFHSDIINLSSQYNDDPSILTRINGIRANRPIIEFDADLYLFNNGQTAKAPIDIIDFTVTNALKYVEGQPFYDIQLPNGKIRPLTDGTRIIFAGDNDPEVRNRIYRVDFITLATGTQIHLVSQSTQLLPTYSVDHCVLSETDSPYYSFVPSVEFSTPIPSINAQKATGIAKMANTSVKSVEVNGAGINYVADPYIEIDTSYITKADVAPIYETYKYVDFIRLDNAGFGYSDVTVTIDSPNAHDFVQTYGNSTPFASSTIEIDGLMTVNEFVGFNVYGTGINGGTKVVSNTGTEIVIDSIALLEDGNKITLVSNDIDPLSIAISTSNQWFTDEISVDSTYGASKDMYITGGSSVIDINSIELVLPVTVTTGSNHDLVNGDKVIIRGINGTIELNNNVYYVSVLDDTSIELYNDELLNSPIDGRTYTAYVNGGEISSYSIEHGVYVTDVISDTKLKLSHSVSLKSGTELFFVGKTATAVAYLNQSTQITDIVVTDSGSGYSTIPSITINVPDVGVTATATAVLNDNVISHVRVNDGGTGYQLANDLITNVISDVLIETSSITTNGVTYVESDSENIKYIKEGWLAFLVVPTINGDIYTDFARIPYLSNETDGSGYYSDVAMTLANILTVDSVSVENGTINLNGVINSKDSDGENIDLPIGTRIFFTSRSRFFRDGKSSVGYAYADYYLRLAVQNSSTVALDRVNDIQKGMTVIDRENSIGSDCRVVSVDSFNRTIILNKPITLNAGVSLEFSVTVSMNATLNSAKIESILIEDGGQQYTSAPIVTIESSTTPVTKICSCDGNTNVIKVDSLDGIEIGATLESETYASDGFGITVGNEKVKVVSTSSVQTGLETYDYFVTVNINQPKFAGLIVVFKNSARAIAIVTSTNTIRSSSVDDTPETYDSGDTVLVNEGMYGSDAIFQTKIGVQTTNQYWFDGIEWKASQAKTSINQAPLFDVFDENNISASDLDVYTGSKFTGTKLFSYAIGKGKDDTILGFPLAYSAFQNVGDIKFINHFDTDSFTYSVNRLETKRNVNTFFLNKNGVLKNIWTKTNEKTIQYQLISHFYDGKTNYFEIDILPQSSTTVPYLKVYVSNKLLNPKMYRIRKYGDKNVLIIKSSQLKEVNCKVDILIYSDKQSKLGHYVVPSNLDINAENAIFSELTLGQMRTHLISMTENNYGMIGNVLGSNNLRDLNIKGWNGTILQHASPAQYSSLFLGDNGLKFIESIEFASREYAKFKNRFLDQAANNHYNSKNIVETVDSLMGIINVSRNPSMPWYDSDMVPYGANGVVTNIKILNTQQKRYQIRSIFNDKQLSRRSVLVYLVDESNNSVRQLLNGVDFTFNQSVSAIDINNNVGLSYTQYLKVIDRESTLGCYVPETPSKLGLHPKFVPCKYLDKTYETPIFVIQGHDGSITPAFNDFRDDLLLELESRIYNNIKSDYATNIVSLYDYIPGKFRNNEYSRSEFNTVLSKSFLKWSGFNQLDYSSNNTFKNNDAFSWNYKFMNDGDGERLPGFWREIYKYYYDTDRPNTHAWEMLGFSEKPEWWEDTYGAAPYTGGNKVLWEDLEKGYIAFGSRQGYDERFARPGLSKIIPVDEFGNLKSPIQTLVSNFNGTKTSSGWAIGDGGPVESAWRRSSDFSFAIQVAIALCKPAFYFGTLFNTSAYYRNSIGQLLIKDSNQRVNRDTFTVPDDARYSGNVVLTSGYINWVRDYLTSTGIDATRTINRYIKDYQLKLSYKVGGYTDPKYITILADQSSPNSNQNSIVIPSENYKIFLNKSAPVSRIVYSAVIIERTPKGYTVSGYDLNNPYFTIVPSVRNNNAYAITESNKTAVIYKDYQKTKVTVPYGYEFNSRQQIVDFLISYGRYLTGQGLIFTNFSSELQAQQDFVLSAREFLVWSSQGWIDGSVLIVSPIANELRLTNDMGVVDDVTNVINKSRILDQNFNAIRSNQFSVIRNDNDFVITTTDSIIALADLSLVQYEHVILFDNNTLFNDVIYQPQLGTRQYRLKVIGNITGDWFGQLNPPGFIYNSGVVTEWQPNVHYRKGALVGYKDNYYFTIKEVESDEFNFADFIPVEKDSIKKGLLPNFAFNAAQFEHIYDVDNHPATPQLEGLSQSLTGYTNRDYFANFDLDSTSQSKFYSGFIKQKGTINAINALTHAKFNNLDGNIDIHEEWAMRVGDYGSLGSNQFIEVVLNEDDFTNDPSTLIFTNNIENNGFINVSGNEIYRSSHDSFNETPFALRDGIKTRLQDHITAGYPRLDDVDGTMFNVNDFANYRELVKDIGAGYKLWVANDFNGEWNVYRAMETGVLIKTMRVGLGRELIITSNIKHRLNINDFIVIKNFNSNFDGFYKVEHIENNLTFTVTSYTSLNDLRSTQVIDGNGILLVMKSVRMERVNDLVSNPPKYGWRDGDKVWVDFDNEDGSWSVYEKTFGWNFNQLLPIRKGEVNSFEGYGTAIALNVDNTLVIAGTPTSTVGAISGITISDMGSGYVFPTATFSAPNQSGGEEPSVTLTVESGLLINANLTNGGSGYTVSPNVSIVDQTIANVTANSVNTSAIALDSVNNIYFGDLVEGDDGFGNIISSTVVTVSNASVSVSDVISITENTTLTFSRGSNGNVKAILTPTSLANITVIDGGSGFTTTPKIEILSSSGTGATAIATLTMGVITGITVTNGGSGYTSNPIIKVISTNPSVTSFTSNLTPTSVASLVIDGVGSDYKNPILIFDSVLGNGADGTISVLDAGITGVTINSYGSGYTSPPTITISDTGGGVGANLESVLTSGLVKTFTRLDDVPTLRQDQSILPFNINASEFGKSVAMGQFKAIMGAPGSYNEKGAIVIYELVSGGIWLPQQIIMPNNLESGSRFGESLAFSKDENWLYVGCPGSNRVYVYGKKIVELLSQKITVIDGITSYSTLFENVSQLNVKVVSDSGKVFTPDFDYTLVGGTLNFVTEPSRLTNVNYLYLVETAATTVIFPINDNVLQKEYELSFVPQYIEEVLVIGSSQRIYIPNIEYTINGKIITFITDDFGVEGSIVVTKQNTSYQLVETLVPSDITNWVERGHADPTITNISYTVDTLTEANSLITSFTSNDDGKLIKVNNLLNDEYLPYDIYRYNHSDTSLVIVGSENMDVSRGVAKFGQSLSITNNGDKIVIGAPNATQNDITNVGRVYVYDRLYQIFIGSGTTGTFVTKRIISDIRRVFVDDVLQVEGVDFTISIRTVTFNRIIPQGSKVKVEVNKFNIVQKMESPYSVYNGFFGKTVSISPNNHNIFVGSPGYKDVNYYNGRVYRYINNGLVYGTVVAKNNNPLTTSGDTVRFNDVVISLINSETVVEGNVVADSSRLVSDINSAGITGVTASIVDGTSEYGVTGGALTFTTNPNSRVKTINVLPGIGRGLEDLGIEVYSLIQTIEHPFTGSTENFASMLAVDEANGETLVIASEGASSLKNLSFDKTQTVFDDDSTRFVDTLKNSGAVYVYDLLKSYNDTPEEPSNYLFTQQLQDSSIEFNDNFGASVVMNNKWVLVGADRSSYYGQPNSGLIHLFINKTGKKGWEKLRDHERLVDTDFINKIVSYNKNTQLIVENLDYYDPVKGKILGIADQDIDYKTSYDPSVYNKGNNAEVTIDESTQWGQLQVGKVWWNLSTVRFIQYEQGDINYRTAHWGEMFPGSKIEVCEWVESEYLPSEYANRNGDGYAKYSDNSAYVESSSLDEKSGLIRTRYYYWVANKSSVDVMHTRRQISVRTIADIIENPKNQDIPYISIIANNAFSVYNFNKLLNSDDVVLRIEYSNVLSNNIAHSEYELVAEGGDNSIPTVLLNKLIDSLAGENEVGELVPDIRLNPIDRLGVSKRPRQSMIDDQLSAIKVFVSHVNAFFAKNLITREFNINALKASEPIPSSNSGEYNIIVSSKDELYYFDVSELAIGYRILVESDYDAEGYWTIYELSDELIWELVRVQGYDSTRYWHYENWYATGFNNQIVINHIVPTFNDIVKARYRVGDVVKVMDGGAGLFELYIMNNDMYPVLIGAENGTIQLNDGLYNLTESLIGFDNAGFDSTGFSKTYSTELRIIINGIFNSIFTGVNKTEINKLFFVLVRYILSEQKTVDWLLKTSFISVLHKIRKLNQYPNYIRDQQDYYQQYIDEVKPYRTQVRNYLLDYEGLDDVNSVVTDFDLPSVYDSITRRYRKLNLSNANDLEYLKTSPSANWLYYHGYSITSIDVIDGGSGYTSTPSVTIEGGRGSGARANAVVENGKVISIDIISHGAGYTSTPSVIIEGGNGSGARAYARFRNTDNTNLNHTVRNIITTLNFDRIAYSTNVKQWKPYVSYTAGDIIVVPSSQLTQYVNVPYDMLPKSMVAYQVMPNKTLLGDETIDLNKLNNSSIVTKLTGTDIENAIDRLAIYNLRKSPDSAIAYLSNDTVSLNECDINNTVDALGTQWNDVTSTNDLYVMVGNKGLIATSGDGLNWTVRNSDIAQNIRGITKVNGIYAAVANQGVIIYSEDAESWDFKTDTISKFAQYKYSPSLANPMGLTQLNASGSIDFTDVSEIISTRANYIIAVGNGSTILLNPMDTSLDVDENWYSVKPQTDVYGIPHSLLTVCTKSMGNVTAFNGDTFMVEMQKSGYMTVSNSAPYLQEGYVVVGGINGGMYITSYARLDDVMHGYKQGYNYNSDDNYPWIPMYVPNDIEGNGDDVSGEQINDIAINDDRWIVAVGSNGTMLWNTIDSPIYQQVGSSTINSDTVGKTIVSQGIEVYNNFRHFESVDFEYPLTSDKLNGINLNAIEWDGEKFVIVGEKSTVLWGYPNSLSTGYIDITNSDPVQFSSTTLPLGSWVGASWVGGTNIDNVTITVPSSNINGNVYVGMRVVAGNVSSYLPNDAEVIGTNYDGNGTIPTTWSITVGFSAANVTSANNQSMTFTYGTNKEIFEDDIITLVDVNGFTKEMTVTQNVSVGSTRIYVNGIDNDVTSNWRITGNGIPRESIVKAVGKFANFTWKYGKGSGRNTDITYNALSFNGNAYNIAGSLSHIRKDIYDNIPGTSYTGDFVTGTKFNSNISVDTTITSEFSDDTLGVKPQDIVIMGGQFIDAYSSHAPEELVPGYVTDSLQMNVFTANIVGGIPDYNNVIAYKVFIDSSGVPTYYRLPSSNTTVITTMLSYNDDEIFVDNIDALPTPNTTDGIPGSIWINGERINYFDIDRNRKVLKDIRRGVNRTSVPLIHEVGTILTDASNDQLIYTDTINEVTVDVEVNNGFAGNANTVIFHSSTNDKLIQSKIWID